MKNPTKTHGAAFPLFTFYTSNLLLVRHKWVTHHPYFRPDTAQLHQGISGGALLWVAVCSYPQVEGLDHKHRARLDSMQGVDSILINSAAGSVNFPGTMYMQQGRARLTSAPPGTGDPEQRLPDQCVGCRDVCNHALDASCLPRSISGRKRSTCHSYLHPMASVFGKFYIAQDKQHLTKQTADCIRNL